MKENAILLVDADGDSEAIVSEAATLVGREVLVVKTSRDAFRILEDQMQRLALVIVDVDPGTHGLALLEAISSCADKPQIVVITALEETYMTPIAVKHGAAACLGKPITLHRLHSTLNDVATRSLTSDRWGCLAPSTTANEILNVSAHFRGIAAKLSPAVWATGAHNNTKECQNHRGRSRMKVRAPLKKRMRRRFQEDPEQLAPKFHDRSPWIAQARPNSLAASSLIAPFLIVESLDERERRG